MKQLLNLFVAFLVTVAICDAQTTQSTTVPINFIGTTGVQYFSIPNRNQTAHTVQVQWPSIDTGCSVQLDGSSDGINWFGVASASSQYAAGFEGLVANGYYTFLRIKVFATLGCNGIVHSGKYTGYQYPLPISKVISVGTFQTTPTSGTAASQLTFSGGPINGISSFQCYNPAASVAYLQILNSPSNVIPNIGPHPYAQFIIPPTQVFPYTGTEIVGPNEWYIGASTTPGGATAFGTALTCTFEQDFTGPWAPLLLPSP